MENCDAYAASPERIEIFSKMENEFDNRNRKYFVSLLTHPDLVVRTRAVCILADIGGEAVVREISWVLKNDRDVLVRHEAAFCLGQLGFASGVEMLSHAVESDPSFFVRHEAAVALGVIGSERARHTLNKALNDENEEVRKSAVIALANLDYIIEMKRNNRFSKKMGG
jgi:HEAT repeat protein